MASALLALGLALAPAWPAEAPEELPPVLVVGERPGPALWKVTWRDHVLWILPTLAPLPRGLTWRSSEVEEAVAQSQEVFSEASLVMRIGGEGEAQLQVMQALMNPEGTSLRDFMPPDLFAQFEQLQAQYAGTDRRLERARPFAAALELRKRALASIGLDSDGQVHDYIGYLSRKHLVPLRGLGRAIEPRPKALVADLARTPPQADIDCARWQLTQLQRELRSAAVRANAWSAGNLPALREDWEVSQQQRQAASCLELFQHLAPTKRAIRNTRERGYDELRKALRRNKSTVALVFLEEVFDPEGVMARFRKAGYTVLEPDMGE